MKSPTQAARQLFAVALLSLGMASEAKADSHWSAPVIGGGTAAVIAAAALLRKRGNGPK